MLFSSTILVTESKSTTSLLIETEELPTSLVTIFTTGLTVKHMNFYLRSSFSTLLLACSVWLGGCEKGTTSSQQAQSSYVESLATCFKDESFSHKTNTCLLTEFATNPASNITPESFEFRDFREGIIAAGYDSETRRASLIKSTAKLAPKFQEHTRVPNRQAIALIDTFLDASLKTQKGSNQAVEHIKTFEVEAKAGGKDFYYIEKFDPLMKLWLEKPTSFDTIFIGVLADRYIKEDIFSDNVIKQNRLRRLKNDWGISPYFALAKAYDFSGDDQKAQELRDMYKMTEEAQRLAYLQPVSNGSTLLASLDLEVLKARKLSAQNFLPIVMRQIENNSPPKEIFNSLAYAMEHGAPYSFENDVVSQALNYADNTNDLKAIQVFANLLIKTPVQTDNGVASAMKRGNQIENDLIVSRYLASKGDSERVKALSKKWHIYSRTYSSNGGKRPVWAGTSISNFVSLQYLAEDYSAGDEYLNYHLARGSLSDTNLMNTQIKAAATSTENLEMIGQRLQHLTALGLSDAEMVSYYKGCKTHATTRNESVFEKCNEAIQNASTKTVESDRLAATSLFYAAKAEYNVGNNARGRDLFKRGLFKAEQCGCLLTRSYKVINKLILAELNAASQSNSE